MIESTLIEPGILVIKPSSSLEESDFERLSAEIDPRLEAGEKLNGLLIDAEHFSGWKNLAGLAAHIRFVKNHHRKISRIAFLSDNAFLSALPKIARHFVKAEPKSFSSDDREEALLWLATAPDEEPETALRYSWFPEEDLAWISLDGKVTSQEYNEFLKWIESILAEHSPISFLIDFDDLEGAEPGAILSDMKFGMSHLKDVKRLALVGDEKWLKYLASLPNPFSFELKAFQEDDEEQAWEWIRS